VGNEIFMLEMEHLDLREESLTSMREWNFSGYFNTPAGHNLLPVLLEIVDE
jgi:hypothetical protein